MNRTWLNGALVTAILFGIGGLVESLRAGGEAFAAGGQIVLRQTPLGPMPTDQRELSLTPDAAHVALLATAGSRHVVYIDGNEGSPYSSVQQTSAPGQGNSAPAPRMLMISPDQKRVAYLASKGPTDWMMVLNNKEGPAFERINIAMFSPVGHRLAYVANKGGKTYIVVDATISPAYQQVLAAEMRFSADGEHFGYLGQTGTGATAWHAIIDGKGETGYVQVERLQFSHDGGHYAYIARTANGDEFSVVVDGQAGPKYSMIQSITLSNDGKHVAFVAVKPRDAKVSNTAVKWVAVIDGQAGLDFDQISDITLSPDGQHSAYAGMEFAVGGRNLAYAMVDGKKSLDYGVCSTFTYSADSQHLAYIAINNNKSVVVLDGREFDAHNSVAPESLHFTADGKRLGYIVRDDDGWRAVIDGKAGPVRGGIDAKSLAFSPDGQHYRFKTNFGSAWAVIADDAPTPAIDQPVTGELLTSADGKHTATLIIKDFENPRQAMRVMFDGKPAGPECQTIQQMQLSPDGAHVAYIGTVLEAPGSGGNGKNAVHVILDGHSGPGYFRVDKFAFSPDGRHVAYAARGGDGKMYVDVDDFQGPAYDDVIAITGDCPQAIQFRADGSLDYLVVTGKTLNRIVMPADMIRSLPKPVEPNAPGSPGYAQIYAFGQVKDDGAKPAVLAAARDGTLFGATHAGGEFKKGVLFSVKPDGTDYKILRSIEGGRGDGANAGSLRVGPDGALYGSLEGEGPSGHGAIFRAAADGSAYTLIHSFTGNKDGGTPAIYAVDADGTLWGLSSRNRTPLHLFRMNPDGSEFKIVYEAPETPGYNDKGVGPFVDGGDGYFYGVAGMNIFKVARDGNGYAVVRKFQGPPRDINMADRAPILGADHMLYGFASSGGTSTGGVIYKIARDGSGYAVIVNPSDDVLQPRAMVEGPDGKLYVLARHGLVRVNTDGSEFTVLKELDGGFFPLTALVRDGVFYGMTAQGNKGGFIFRYGISGAPGSAPGSGGIAAAPSVVFQSVPPTPIDSNVEIPPATGQ